jgi:hypothetical protein
MSAKSITVLGRQISYEISNVDIHTIEYYPANPRINYIISKFPLKDINQNLIEMELLKLESTMDRIRDIEENKGMIDEVYILKNQVVEGNTRLCAYRRLYQKYNKDNRWKFIKAKVLQDDVSEEELFYILGIFHIRRKKEWAAYEKAPYINKMINTLKKTPEEICKQLGMHKKTLEAALKAYNVMSKKYLSSLKNNNEINSTKDDLKKFSYFDAFYHQKELVQRAQDTPDFEDLFVQWVKDDRLKNAQSVRELPKILSNKKACKAFSESDPEEALEDAKQILYEHKPEKVDRFYKKIREFRDLLREAEVNIVKDEIETNKNKKAELNQCYRDLKKFCKEVGLDI